VYTLTATDPVPCSKSTTLNVTVNQTPVLINNYVYSTSTGNAITPGTALVTGSQGDDVTANVVLPFTYIAYGTAYTSVNVCSNGNLQFTTANAAFTNTCPLPTSTNLGVTFMPHWDDLWTLNAGEGIYTSVSGIAPNRILNIEWRAS
jgi:hypothetical protein